MRIEFSDSRCVRLSTVSQGDTFLYCQKLYMIVSQADTDDTDKIYCLCVCLADGSLRKLLKNDLVEQVSAHVVID